MNCVGAPPFVRTKFVAQCEHQCSRCSGNRVDAHWGAFVHRFALRLGPGRVLQREVHVVGHEQRRRHVSRSQTQWLGDAVEQGRAHSHPNGPLHHDICLRAWRRDFVALEIDEGRERVLKFVMALLGAYTMLRSIAYGDWHSWLQGRLITYGGALEHVCLPPVLLWGMRSGAPHSAGKRLGHRAQQSPRECRASLCVEPGPCALVFGASA